MPTKESALIRKCRIWVKQHGGLYHKDHASSYSEKGWPDVTVIIHGKTHLIEFKKSEKEVPSKFQLHVIEMINKAGGHAFVCGSFEDFIYKVI